MSYKKFDAKYTFSRFKGFMWTFSRSKRGVVGIAIIIFFTIIAIFGPLTSPHDPLKPTWPGYYPAPSQPPLLARRMALPAWYSMLPGGGNLSHNMAVVSDHEFSTLESFNKWNRETIGPVAIEYDQNAGIHEMKPPTFTRSNNACMQISYTPFGEGSPTQAVAKISYNFTYPWNNPPEPFWIHHSWAIMGNPETGRISNVSIKLAFYRIDRVPLEGYNDAQGLPYPYIPAGDAVVYHYPLITYTYKNPQSWIHAWTRSNMNEIFLLNNRYYMQPHKVIFPRPGNYSFAIEVVFEGNETTTVYMDNINVLLYGDVFGLMGTDDGGLGAYPRDLYTSLVNGARISLIVGLLAAFISVTIGLIVGLVAGYIGGKTDELLMRFTDMLLVLPGLPLMIVIVTVLRPSIWNIIGVLSLLGWMGFSRNIRSMTLSLRERTFIEAAKASGAGKRHVLIKHLLPNVFALVYLALAVSVPGAIVTEASLSFLGLGDPNTTSWGMMFYEFQRSGVAAMESFSNYWFWVIPPGVAISLLSISFIMLGYSLDEIFNPKLRMRR